MSAASVSRTGLPLSQLSAIARIDLFSSMTSAMRFSTRDRSVVDASPHATRAAWAASSASSTSSGVDAGISVNGFPVTGVRFALYRPFTGATHRPPMKLSYRGRTSTMLSGLPGTA